MSLMPDEIRRIHLEAETNSVNAMNFCPKISVIIPAYNTEKYISKCLLSLIKQTLKEIEIVVVDDGSSDNTVEIVSEYAKYDKRIHLLKQQHAMQGAARNLGMRNSSGEYIGFVDSDDWVDEDYYEKLYNAAHRYRADIALATNVRIGHGKTKKRLNIGKEDFVIRLQEKIDITNQFKNPCPTNKIYKKAFIMKNNIDWKEGVFCEDKLFTVKAVYYANGIVTVPNTYYYYYRNPDSTVNTKTKEHLIKVNEDKYNAKIDVLKFLKEKNVNIKDEKICAETSSVKLFNIKLLSITETIHKKLYLLFGIMPIWIIKEK